MGECIVCEKSFPQKDLIDGDFCELCWHKDECKECAGTGYAIDMACPICKGTGEKA